MLALRADPWTPDHGMGFEARLDEPPARVDPAVERSDWDRPLRPAPGEGGPVWFVDGVRRIELRLLADEDGRRAYGLFGSVAAGAVRSDGRATFERALVRRLLITGGGLGRPDPVRLRLGETTLEFESLSEPGGEPDDPLLRLQKEMQRAELDLALELAGSGEELVLADGRWSSQRPTPAPVVGVVKRWSREYLEPRHEALVAALGPGERTPLFALAEPDREFERYAWYVRLVPLRPAWHDHAGVVRCETRSGIGLEAAVALADRVSALLPAFAGRPSDPRAPQNLAPVGALEAWLQHRLGHRGLIRRALTAWLIEQGG
jgi:hypothetical protein